MVTRYIRYRLKPWMKMSKFKSSFNASVLHHKSMCTQMYSKLNDKDVHDNMIDWSSFVSE